MANIRFGPAGIPLSFGSISVDEAVKKTKTELNLDAFELEFVYGARGKKETMENIAKISKELDIAISSHAPYYLNLCNKEKFEGNKRHLVSSLKLTETANGRLTVFHPGYYQKLSKEEAYKEAKKQLKEIYDIYISTSSKPILLGAETVGKKSQFGGLEEVLKLSQEFDFIIPVIDFSHLVARGDFPLKTEEDYEKLFSYLEKELNEYVKNIHSHFSEIEYTEKGERKHLPLETNNTPPYKPLINVMVEKGYGGTIISESPILEKDAIKMKKYYEMVMR